MDTKQTKTVRSVFNGAPVQTGSTARPASAASATRRVQSAGVAGQAQRTGATRQTQNPLNPTGQKVANPVSASAMNSGAKAGTATDTKVNATVAAGNSAINGAKTGASSGVSASNNTASKKQGKSGAKSGTNMKVIIGVIVAVLVCVGIGIGVAFAMRGNGGKDSGEGEENVASNTIEENTEEMQRITDETIKKYAEVNVEGYQEINDESFQGNAVVVTVKNGSEETVSLAIEIGAYDAEGNLLDTSSVYAEMIEPGQTHRFNTFVYSELSPEQLKSATYKVYKASTYTVEGVQEETVTTEETTEGVVDGGENVEQSVQEGE